MSWSCRVGAVISLVEWPRVALLSLQALFSLQSQAHIIVFLFRLLADLFLGLLDHGQIVQAPSDADIEKWSRPPWALEQHNECLIAQGNDVSESRVEQTAVFAKTEL